MTARLFHIAYSPETKAGMEAGFELLDNLANPRPDWFEYWPVRQWLTQQTLDESCFYGFFSPKFRAKTGLGAAEVRQHIEAHGREADVLLYSPFPTQIACYLNVFEQGEQSHAGFMQACMDALQAIGQAVPLPGLVMDARQMVYSNYFVARPAFWREWLRWTQAVFVLAEAPDSTLRERLQAPTAYAGSVQIKVFLIERIASLLLATQPRWRVVAHNPFGHHHASEPDLGDPMFLVSADALKQAYRNLGSPEYLQAFLTLRQWLASGAARR
jgi:hypothetical protein